MNKKTKELNKQNNLLDKKISNDNQPIFTDMICYLRSSNLTDYDIEVIRRDLSEMVISAQERGESISDVIGGNFKEFCDEVIASVPPKTKLQKIIDFLDVCCWVLSILFAINIIISKDTILMIEDLFRSKPIDFSLSVSIGNAILVVIILLFSYTFVYTICKNSFIKEIKYKKTAIFISLTIIMGLLVFVVTLGKETLFTVNLWIACMTTIILFVAHKFLNRI